MATSALPVIGIALLTLTACDLSQKKPETIKAALPPAHANVRAPDAPGGSATGVENGAAERSIRLYGPGVSRKRQTRV